MCFRSVPSLKKPPPAFSTLSSLYFLQNQHRSSPHSLCTNHRSSDRMSTKPSTAEFLKAIEHRRTVYPLTNKVDVSDDRIVEIVQEVLKVSPSSYNTQPMRVAIMLGEEHVKLWKIVREHAMPILQSAGEKVVEMMSSRIDMFSKAYGSVSTLVIGSRSNLRRLLSGRMKILSKNQLRLTSLLLRCFTLGQSTRLECYNCKFGLLSSWKALVLICNTWMHFLRSKLRSRKSLVYQNRGA